MVNPQEADVWKETLLEEIFEALSKSGELRRILIFKGARILNKLLDTDSRRSLDLDSNLTKAFTLETHDRETQRQVIEALIGNSLTAHFESLSPLKYTVEQVTVSLRPMDNLSLIHISEPTRPY